MPQPTLAKLIPQCPKAGPFVCSNRVIRGLIGGYQVMQKPTYRCTYVCIYIYIHMLYHAYKYMIEVHILRILFP